MNNYEKNLYFDSMTEKEKKSIIDAVDLLESFCMKARYEGILSLEFELDDIEDRFIHMLMMLVIDGNSDEVVESIGKNLINSTELSDAEILRRKVILSGILSIQKGDNPLVMIMLLGSMLGDDCFYALKKKYTEEWEVNRVARNSGTQSQAENENKEGLFSFEDVVMMDDDSVKKIIDGTDLDSLALAVFDSDVEVKGKFMRNLPEDSAKKIEETISRLGDVSKAEIEDAQQKIVESIKKLEDLGEIAVIPPSDLFDLV